MTVFLFILRVLLLWRECLLNQDGRPAGDASLCHRSFRGYTPIQKQNLLPNYKYSISYSAYCGFIFIVLTSTVPSVCPCLCELGLIAFSFFALLLDEKLVTRFITVCHARVPSCSLWLCARFVLASQPLFDHPGLLISGRYVYLHVCLYNLLDFPHQKFQEIDNDFSKEKYSFQSLL